MNSSLVNYTKLSPNYNARDRKISKITIHHMAGNLTVETCGNVFASSAREASANYGIGSDGRVGLYVEEKNRSWASSNRTNDMMAVTIEVANDGGAPDWHVSDKALAKLIDLCVDICKKNGISKLNYTGDASGNLTLHKMFIATTCPGPYLESKCPYIESEVNKRLGMNESEMYRIRKSWADVKSQIGAYRNLDNAKKACPSGYYVFNSAGKVVYPVVSNESIDYAQSFDPAKAGKYTVVPDVGLHLRAGAGTDKRSLEVLGQGDIVTCYGYFTQGWLLVQTSQGRTGYVCKDYLK